jgi:hypothetical protein
MHLIKGLASKRSTVAVANLYPVPVVEICTYVCSYVFISIGDDDMSNLWMDKLKRVRPGFTAGLLLMMPVKGISLSMWSDEPRPELLVSWHVLALLHHAPPCMHSSMAGILLASVSVL